MFLLYDLIFLFISIFYIPVYLLKGKFHKGFGARFGKLPTGLNLERPIWVHAVSVGEANAVRGLIEELRKVYPGKKFVISTVTATGNKIARSIAQEGDLVTYLPLDFSFTVRSVVTRVNPSLFILAETEIWPNLITCLWKRNIPIITVNGRISDSSFKGYMALRLLARPVLRRVSLFCCQTEVDRQRLLKLGVEEARIKVTGNMKFDSTDYADRYSADYADKVRERFGLSRGDKLLVCGSTHPGEEEIILKSYKELLKDFTNLKLLIAPRHPERAGQVKALADKSAAGKVFILDTVGELLAVYAQAEIVFVGGSLVRHGGQNILEPASLGKPVIFGPHMFNFRDISELFLLSGAGIMVCNAEELKKAVSRLLQDVSLAQQLSRAAFGLIQANRGATLKNIREIQKLLSV